MGSQDEKIHLDHPVPQIYLSCRILSQRPLCCQPILLLPTPDLTRHQPSRGLYLQHEHRLDQQTLLAAKYIQSLSGRFHNLDLNPCVLPDQRFHRSYRSSHLLTSRVHFACPLPLQTQRWQQGSPDYRHRYNCPHCFHGSPSHLRSHQGPY